MRGRPQIIAEAFKYIYTGITGVPDNYIEREAYDYGGGF